MKCDDRDYQGTLSADYQSTLTRRRQCCYESNARILRVCRCVAANVRGRYGRLFEIGVELWIHRRVESSSAFSSCFCVAVRRDWSPKAAVRPGHTCILQRLQIRPSRMWRKHHKLNTAVSDSRSHLYRRIGARHITCHIESPDVNQSVLLRAFPTGH